MKMTIKSFDYKKMVSLWLPVFLWMVVIFLFSSMRTPSVTNVTWTEFIIKKTAHVIEYFTLCSLLYRGFFGSGTNKRSSIIFSFLISAFYAVTDEFHQSFTPGREPKIRDIFIDTSAVFFAILFLTKYLPVSPDKVQKLAKKLTFL